MPAFCSLSSIRVASQDHVLRLKITHNLAHGSPSDVVHTVKGRLPKELDILWLSDVSISLSGSLDGDEISAHDIVNSGLVRHLQTQLKANTNRLGLNNVSRPFVDDADGLSKLTLTPSRSLPDASRPHTNLVSLHIAYIWRTVAGRSGASDSGHLVEEVNPFSPVLFLPAETLLNRVTEQFLIYHLVSRYPLIFGPWCKRLDVEMRYFPSIGHSIVEIMSRSQNCKFRSRCKRLLKIALRQHKFVLQTAAAVLSSCADDAVPETTEEEMEELSATPVLTDEQVLCESLEELFRLGVPQRRFKLAATVTPHFVPLPQDDDDSLLRCTPDIGLDDEDSWVELPDIAMSPCTPDFHPSLPEDMDIFAQEDWYGGGMWRLHEADVGEREFDAPSDESLIGGSITLTSITARSPQADPVSLYHHQDVDPELDPARSGSRYKVSQLACLEEPRTPAVFANSACSSSHELRDRYYLSYEPVTVEAQGFQLEDWYEVADSDSILFELDIPDDADVTDFEEVLV